MRNVGMAVAASAWLLAVGCEETTALSVAALVSKAGEARVAIEQQQGPALAAAGSRPAHGKHPASRDRRDVAQVVREAVRSASRLVIGPASPAFAAKLDDLAKPFDRDR